MICSTFCMSILQLHNSRSHNSISHNSISHNSISHNSISHNSISLNSISLKPAQKMTSIHFPLYSIPKATLGIRSPKQFKYKVLLLLFVISVFFGCAKPPTPPPFELTQANSSPPSEKPKLVLLVVVDQFPFEYLERFSHLWTGGIQTLMKQGAIYSNAFHSHALTETCPGHATLATGHHPSQHGIVSNYWPDRLTGAPTYCVSDKDYRVSPHFLEKPTVGDILKNQSSRSKVYSVSGKDRAAVMLGGKNADGAYWYNLKKGIFISSEYYSQNNPEWLKAFNGKKQLDLFFSQSWDPLPINENDLSLAGVKRVDHGGFQYGLPLPIGGPKLAPDSSFYSAIFYTPFIDDYTGLLAEEVLKAETLGKDEYTDLLAVSFSATDSIGHLYGPESFEILDNLMRLDATLQHLFAIVDQTVGLSNTLIVFSSDHGVQPLPEAQRKSLGRNERLNTPDIKCIQGALNSRPEARSMLIGDSRVSNRQILPLIQDGIGQCPNVKHVWTSSELEAPPTTKNLFHQLYANSYFRGRSPDFTIQWKEHFLPLYGSGTNHGSPYPYDAHVPVIFMGPQITHETVTTPFDTTEVAGKILKLAGVSTQK
jgi:predicted AlkP superfamily pyrophosphatase or phosphodiesterase